MWGIKTHVWKKGAKGHISKSTSRYFDEMARLPLLVENKEDFDPMIMEVLATRPNQEQSVVVIKKNSSGDKDYFTPPLMVRFVIIGQLTDSQM